MLSRNKRATSGAALRSEKRSLKVWEPYALLLRQEENFFVLLRAKVPKPLYQPMRRGQSYLLRMPKYRPLPVRFGLTLFPGAVQYAQAEKLGMENILISNCPCMK